MKKLLSLITLILMTLTVCSQTTQVDTMNSTLNLRPINVSYNGVKYKAFTFDQTKIILKELATLEYLVHENEIRENWILDLTAKSNEQASVITMLKSKDSNSQSVIANMNSMLSAKDNIISIKNADIAKRNRIIFVGGAVSISVIALLLVK